ncbi:putative quinol monooxygenase [Campylobacter sp. LR291e]|nr:antibiotic biosynthesis monooxygenase [Campylobacter sp. LR291e]
MDNMIVRISDIKIYPEYLNEYLTYAKEVAETSMEKEKGVIALYPMIVIKDNTQIKILEIYKNQVAYEEHIKTKHFQKYKQGTLHMVKSLELIDTYQLSEKNFKRIFKY